jgi:hypothetical protein
MNSFVNFHSWSGVKTPTTSGTALITNGSLRSTHNYQQMRNQQPQHFSMVSVCFFSFIFLPLVMNKTLAYILATENEPGECDISASIPNSSSTV